MRKILFLLIALPMLFTACSPKEEDNRIVGTTWAWEDYLFGFFEGGTWYKIIQFTGNDTYTAFYRKSDGMIKNKSEDNRYWYQDTKVTLYYSNGEEWNTFIFDGDSKMYPVTNENVVFEKQ